MVKSVGVSFFIFLLLISLYRVDAQNTTLECGDISESEFTENGQVHRYQIAMESGDILQVNAIPIGQTLMVDMAILGPTGIGLVEFSIDSIDFGEVSSSQTPILSARGFYKVVIANMGIYDDGEVGYNDLGVGVYNIEIGCIKEDGRVIQPGDTLTEVELTNVPADTFNGVGFPGAAAQDFTVGVTVPLQLGAVNSGSLSPGFQGIFGYSFDGQAGNIAELTFTRLTGNLSLGLAVVSEDNTVAFQTSLISANNLRVEFPLPVTGIYTIGVYLISLSPPANPENTSFSIQVDLR